MCAIFISLFIIFRINSQATNYNGNTFSEKATCKTIDRSKKFTDDR